VNRLKKVEELSEKVCEDWWKISEWRTKRERIEDVLNERILLGWEEEIVFEKKQLDEFWEIISWNKNWKKVRSFGCLKSRKSCVWCRGIEFVECFGPFSLKLLETD
jgi:hypothetical protein